MARGIYRKSHSDTMTRCLTLVQDDFLITMARVPKERVLGVDVYAAIHYTKVEIEEVEDEEEESDGEVVLL